VRLLRASAFLNDRKEVDLMDCFLMTYCLWNEEEQIATVYGFVDDASKKYGYTVSLDFKGIKEELKKFQEEINEETKFIKDTKKQNLVLVHNDYYEIVNPPGNYEKLIKKSDFYNLSNQDQNINLYYWDASWNQVKTAPRSYYGNRNSARIGSSKFNVVINHVEYTLKQTATDEKRQATRKPHPSVEKDWDGRVSVYLQDTDKMKAQIEEYRNKDLKFLRVNTFVSPELANVVESHIIDVLKSVEKIEVEIKEIQNKYKKLKDEEIVS
jgi:MoxR-like ATPase